MWQAWAWFMGGPLRYKLAMTAVRIGRADGEVPAVASGQARRVDPRPRAAASARPRVPQLVAQRRGYK